MSESTQTIAQDIAPDWATFERTILCPLCDYDLRGLVEPRCPEFGHTFEWGKLLDEGQRAHPWLFEHARTRCLSAYVMTLRASMRPRWFWASVRPEHHPRAGRLVGYWMIQFLLVTLAILPCWGIPVFQQYQRQAVWWAQAQQYANNPANQATIAATWGNKQNFLRSIARPNPLPDLLWETLFRTGWMHDAVVPMFFAFLTWPCLTIATLFIYQSTMRQARIKSSHVLRCVIYSGDAALLLGPAMGLAYWFWGFSRNGDWEMLWAAVAVQGLLAYRLIVAYRRYLNFPHAIAAVLASQTILFLFFFNALLMWHRL